MAPRFQCVKQKEIELNNVNDILVAGDPGCTGFDDEARDIFGSILSQKADLFIIAGDLVFTGVKDELEEFVDFCDKKASAPVFSLCGNHDLPGYYERCGFSSYALISDQLVCILLDDSKAHFSPEDISFLEEELKRYPKKRFIVFFHIPPPVHFNTSTIRPGEWEKLRSVLDKFKDRIECLICGHIHGFYEYIKDGYRIFITAGGGGKMIYDMPDPRSGLYHALKISLKDGALSGISVIPVKFSEVI